MGLLVYSMVPLSKEEGIGNVALNVAERLEYKKTFLSLGRFRKLLFYSFLSPFWFALKVSKIKPNVVLVHTTEASFDPLIAKKIFGFKYKIICVAHGVYEDLFDEYKKEVRLGNTKKRRIFMLNVKISAFRARFVSGCDKIIAVSNNVKKSLKKRYNVDSIVIPNGVGKINSVKKTKGNNLLFVGNQFWLKGLHYLIKANNLLKRKWNMVVVGLDEQQKLELCSLVDCEGIIFKQKMSHDKLYVEYSKADVFAMPSLYESFGITYLEALSFGLPLIASKGTGAEDIVNNKNGVLVKKRDVFALTNALEKIRKYKKSSLLDKKFLWKNIASQYALIIDSVNIVVKKGDKIEP
jgi:glycosyltransferase involved in cell wall biosynthesis